MGDQIKRILDVKEAVIYQGDPCFTGELGGRTRTLPCELPRRRRQFLTVAVDFDAGGGFSPSSSTSTPAAASSRRSSLGLLAACFAPVVPGLWRCGSLSAFRRWRRSGGCVPAASRCLGDGWMRNFCSVEKAGIYRASRGGSQGTPRSSSDFLVTLREDGDLHRVVVWQMARDASPSSPRKRPLSDIVQAQPFEPAISEEANLTIKETQLTKGAKALLLRN
ncbi:hypothetical protein ACP70R_015203 [Stipagrostis hirtigluma subsp. patula]